MRTKKKAFVVSATPFDDRGRLDEMSLRRHLRRLCAAGVSGVYMGAPGAGETFAITPEERDRMLSIAVEELKGKIGVRSMGWEPRLIEEMVEFIRRTEPIKPDAVMVFSMDMGHGVKPTRAEMDRYYSSVVGATSLPVVLSTSHMVGYFLPLDLLENLLDRFSNIIGVAYGGTDINYLSALIQRLGQRIEILCSSPQNALPTMMLGGSGWEGFEGNFAPELYAAVISAFNDGDDERLRESYSKLLALNALTAGYGGPSSMRAMKPLMNAFGLPGAGALRSPRLPIDQSELERLIEAVLRLELPGIPTALPARANV